MATHGTIGPFQHEKEDWTSYTERLEQYFAASDVQNAVKQRALLLSSCGASTYQAIRNLTAPNKLTERTFKEIVALVKDHYCPPPSEIVQRFTFNTRSQKEGETIAEFVAELHWLSEHCKFNDSLDDMLRDRVVCGIRDVRLQRQLLAESDLTFKKAFEICQATELAANNARNLQVGKDQKSGGTVMTIQSGKGPSRPSMALQCYRCNSTQHWAKDCRFKTAECHKCRNRGHLAEACWSKSTQPRHLTGKKQKNLVAKTHQVASDNSSGEEEEIAAVLLRMSSTKAAPIQVVVNLDGSDVTMEVDTGASVSVMSETTFQKLWEGNCPKLNPTDVKLRTCTCERLKVLGSITVQVKYQEQTVALGLIIVGGAGPTLLGRDWLKHIQLDWNRISNLSRSSPPTLDSILQQHKAIFKHLHHLQEVLARLEKAGIRLKKDKCKFLLPSVEYLGHIISHKGLQPTPNKIKPIVEAPTPKDVTQLRSILGLVNYYSKFLPQSSSLLAPLYQLLQKAQKWIWGEAQAKHFRKPRRL